VLEFSSATPQLVFVSFGSHELENPRQGPWGDPKENTEAIKEAGMNTHFYVSTYTAHEFQPWRRSLLELAPLLFKEQKMHQIQFRVLRMVESSWVSEGLTFTLSCCRCGLYC
jgi:hypothetical protein